MYESGFVVSLFLMYLLLWKWKQVSQRRQTGIDPEVFDKATSPLQQYMAKFSKFMTVAIILLIVFHATGVQYYSLFTRFPWLDYFQVDLIGFVVGLIGLTICGVAQKTMGNSWRVGIDEINRPELVTTGIFKYIRNPTYLGLMLLIIGVWLIWPTWTIGTFALFFIFFLEIQVRCEEEYLLKIHGDRYRDYCSKTGRYFFRIK